MMSGNSARTIPTRRARLRHLLAIAPIGIVLIAPSSLFGQASATGSMSGTVTDPSGGVLPGVTVTVENPATGLARPATSDAGGAWAVQMLPVGRYRVTLELDGFKKLVKDGVDVEAAVNRSVPTTLEVG